MRAQQMLQVKAYEYLKDVIKKGELKAGEIYSLTKISKEIGVSRTPLRDAVLRLEQERYIDVYPSKGFVIHKMTRTDIVETYQMRCAIEFYCIKQLEQNLDTEIGQEYLAKLDSKIAMQEEIFNTSKSSEDFARKDYEFHRSVVQFVGNESMLSIYKELLYRIFSQTVYSFSQEGRMNDALNEHKKIMNALKNHNLKELEEVYHYHLNVAQDINIRIIE